jgi:hypothetical protein
MTAMSGAPDEGRRDPWSLNPTMALGIAIVLLIGGIALALDAAPPARLSSEGMRHAP